MTYLIAEVGANHNQSLNRAIRLIDSAAECGFHAVKFQLFTLERLFHKTEIRKSPGVQLLRGAELPVDWVPILKDESKRRGLQFGLSVFSVDDLRAVRSHLDFCKVASYELLWSDLLVAAASTQLPIFLSTGMASEDEVASAVAVFRGAQVRDLTLMHCVSTYPAPPSEANLSAIESLRQKFNLPIGWSDHTVDQMVVERAIGRWAASAVELHFDLEGEGMEGKMGHCWRPEDVKVLIDHTQRWSVIDGDGRKRAMPSEEHERTRRTDPWDGLRPLRSERQD